MAEFKKGDRVKLARYQYPDTYVFTWKDRGTVLKILTGRTMNVKWDGYKYPEVWHVDFLEKMRSKKNG